MTVKFTRTPNLFFSIQLSENYKTKVFFYFKKGKNRTKNEISTSVFIHRKVDIQT